MYVCIFRIYLNVHIIIILYIIYIYLLLYLYIIINTNLSVFHSENKRLTQQSTFTSRIIKIRLH
jgi:hypothetical protein